MKAKPTNTSKEELLRQLQELRFQLAEANDTIEAIRTGQIDALVVQGVNGRQLYTLTSADQTYRVFIEKMAEGAVTLNHEGIILYSNSQFANMVEMPLSRVIGLPFEEFIIPESQTSYRENFAKSWRQDCKGESLLKAGEYSRPVQLSFNTLQLEEGISLSIILTDLSAQKEAQRLLENYNQQLEQANRALEISNHDLQQFASVASHDLQEPLRKILIFSNIIKEKDMGLTPESSSYLARIIRSAARMKTLIVDILNYSRLSDDNNYWEYTNLNELLKELLDDFELIIQEKKARVVVGDMPFIDVNKGQIRQVFQNIISNALKFTRPDLPPFITIQSKRIDQRSFDSAENKNGPFCLISIKDNGIGFDTKYLSNIFSLFKRLHSKDEFEGTGIGLAIAKKVIEKHHGLITAFSNEGSGSEFSIILPVCHKGSDCPTPIAGF